MFDSPASHRPRVALLIDADNVQLMCLKEIAKISECFGNLTICRAYGDWRQPPLCTSRDKVRKYKIETIQVDRLGKNATDRRLQRGAVKLLKANAADIFVIASGDSDFRPLCEEIKGRGQTVVGIGNKGQTSPHLRESCHEFYFVEQLPETLNHLTLLCTAYSQAQRPDGLAHMSQVGQALWKLDSISGCCLKNKKLSRCLGEYPLIFKRCGDYIQRL